MRTFFALGLKEGHLGSLIVLGVSTVAVVASSMTASLFVYSGAIVVAVASAATASATGLAATTGLGQDTLVGKDLTKEVLVCRGFDLGLLDLIRGNGTLGWRFWHLYSGGTGWDDGTSGLGPSDGFRPTGLGSTGRLGGVFLVPLVATAMIMMKIWCGMYGLVWVRSNEWIITDVCRNSRNMVTKQL